MPSAFATVALAVSAVVLPATASADRYPGERALPASLRVVTDGATAWWTRQGVTGCAQGIAYRRAPALPESDGITAWGRAVDCQVWLIDDVVTYLTEPELSDELAISACQIVVHEVGHALGLPHSNHGVMAGADVTEPFPYAWTPWWCITWTQRAITAEMRARSAWPYEITIARADIRRLIRQRLGQPGPRARSR